MKKTLEYVKSVMAKWHGAPREREASSMKWGSVLMVRSL